MVPLSSSDPVTFGRSCRRNRGPERPPPSGRSRRGRLSRGGSLVRRGPGRGQDQRSPGPGSPVAPGLRFDGRVARTLTSTQRTVVVVVVDPRPGVVAADTYLSDLLWSDRPLSHPERRSRGRSSLQSPRDENRTQGPLLYYRSRREVAKRLQSTSFGVVYPRPCGFPTDPRAPSPTHPVVVGERTTHRTKANRRPHPRQLCFFVQPLEGREGGVRGDVPISTRSLR